ncbi:ECF-type sigma factor [Roseisolibacter sp. H3M3-2]|uniref:ECF-type sigma factor n=1 Tax=Roseisolibacter sp. H3M3-2 TaxID=3031323 RepID=UPI0023DBBA5A|nr:ECF-type sigma factor [Roseisolibacter sp. H3M3-2]MDF1504788.1 ECF-type sigma factor [Roseisolibacter sp. H3M3-2]
MPERQEPPADPEGHEITAALAVLRRGAPDAMDRLLPLVYGELRGMAHRRLRAEPSGHTFDSTALVHEAWLRLAEQSRAGWADRAHFFAVAGRVMRRVLVDYARRHLAGRRGGGARGVALTDADDAGALVASSRDDALLALDEALARLGALDERLCRVVECRFFAGLSEAETAEALGVSPRTVSRDWTTARGWLFRELRGDDA